MIARSLIICLVILTGLTSLNAQDNAIVLYDNTRYVIGPKGLTEEVEIAIQINNKDGLGLAEVSIPYTSHDNISNIKARIENESGLLLKSLKKLLTPAVFPVFRYTKTIA